MYWDINRFITKVTDEIVKAGKQSFRRMSIHEDTASPLRPAWYQGLHKTPRVGIAISTFGALPSAFVRSLIAVIRDATFKGYVLDVVIEETKPLDASRNICVKELMKNDPQKIIFLDSDMVFPKELIDVLFKDDKDIVSGIYVSKEQTPKPVLKMFNNDTKHYENIWTYPRGEMFEVDAVGCGCLMVKGSVFKKIESPWFKWDNVASLSEDIYFCKKAKEGGYKIWCDSRLEAGHISDIAFITLDDFWHKRMLYEKHPEVCPDIMMSEIRKVENEKADG